MIEFHQFHIAPVDDIERQNVCPGVAAVPVLMARAISLISSWQSWAQWRGDRHRDDAIYEGRPRLRRDFIHNRDSVLSFAHLAELLMAPCPRRPYRSRRAQVAVHEIQRGLVCDLPLLEGHERIEHLETRRVVTEIGAKADFAELVPLQAVAADEDRPLPGRFATVENSQTAAPPDLVPP